MTTPRIDEMVEEFFRFGEFYKDLTETGEKRDRRLVTKSELAQTLTKAHQAGVECGRQRVREEILQAIEDGIDIVELEARL